MLFAQRRHVHQSLSNLLQGIDDEQANCHLRMIEKSEDTTFKADDKHLHLDDSDSDFVSGDDDDHDPEDSDDEDILGALSDEQKKQGKRETLIGYLAELDALRDENVFEGIDEEIRKDEEENSSDDETVPFLIRKKIDPTRRRRPAVDDSDSSDDEARPGCCSFFSFRSRVKGNAVAIHPDLVAQAAAIKEARQAEAEAADEVEVVALQSLDSVNASARTSTGGTRSALLSRQTSGASQRPNMARFRRASLFTGPDFRASRKPSVPGTEGGGDAAFALNLNRSRKGSSVLQEGSSTKGSSRDSTTANENDSGDTEAEKILGDLGEDDDHGHPDRDRLTDLEAMVEKGARQLHVHHTHTESFAPSSLVNSPSSHKTPTTAVQAQVQTGIFSRRQRLVSNVVATVEFKATPVKPITSALDVEFIDAVCKPAIRYLKQNRWEVPMDNILDDQHELLQEALRSMNEYEFDIFKIHDLSNMRPLLYVGYTLFQRLGFTEAFGISNKILINFLRGIEYGYNVQENAYHNSVHAADVLQTSYVFLSKMKLMNRLPQLDIFALFVAAIIHDYRHPGLTNQFLIANANDRDKLFNDVRVLENYHCTAAFRFMREANNNVLSGLSDTKRSVARQKIIQLVLATSLAGQAEFLKEVENKLLVMQAEGINGAPRSRRQSISTLQKLDAKTRSRRTSLSSGKKNPALEPLIEIDPQLGYINYVDFNRTKSLKLVMQMVIKCADVSNASKPWKSYKQWVNNINAEFYKQGDVERANNMPVSRFMDRRVDQRAECQVGFITFLVSPLFSTMWKLCPVTKSLTGKNIANNFARNKAEFETQKKANEDLEAARKQEKDNAEHQGGGGESGGSSSDGGGAKSKSSSSSEETSSDDDDDYYDDDGGADLNAPRGFRSDSILGSRVISGTSTAAGSRKGSIPINSSLLTGNTYRLPSMPGTASPAHDRNAQLRKGSMPINPNLMARSRVSVVHLNPFSPVAETESRNSLVGEGTLDDSSLEDPRKVTLDGSNRQRSPRRKSSGRGKKSEGQVSKAVALSSSLSPHVVDDGPTKSSPPAGDGGHNGRSSPSLAVVSEQEAGAYIDGNQDNNGGKIVSLVGTTKSSSSPSSSQASDDTSLGSAERGTEGNSTVETSSVKPSPPAVDKKEDMDVVSPKTRKLAVSVKGGSNSSPKPPALSIPLSLDE